LLFGSFSSNSPLMSGPARITVPFRPEEYSWNPARQYPQNS
jgi:hypothetical protein